MFFKHKNSIIKKGNDPEIFWHRDNNVDIRGFSNDEGFTIEADENIVGSKLTLYFPNFIHPTTRFNSFTYMRNGNGIYLVRDIPTNVSIPPFYRTSYLRLLWNLSSPQSDKILNISRDNLIESEQRKLDSQLLEGILPLVVKNSIIEFEKSYTGTTSIQNAISYFHLE